MERLNYLSMEKLQKYFDDNSHRLDSVEEALSRIALATERTADSIARIDMGLNGLRGDLVDAATSKSSIPSRVFVYLLFVFGAIIIIERVTNSGTSIHADERGLHIEQQPKTVSGVL